MPAQDAALAIHQVSGAATAPPAGPEKFLVVILGNKTDVLTFLAVGQSRQPQLLELGPTLRLCQFSQWEDQVRQKLAWHLTEKVRLILGRVRSPEKPQRTVRARTQAHIVSGGQVGSPLGPDFFPQDPNLDAGVAADARGGGGP